MSGGPQYGNHSFKRSKAEKVDLEKARWGEKGNMENNAEFKNTEFSTKAGGGMGREKRILM